jgi:signal transduction histidine kinase
MADPRRVPELAEVVPIMAHDLKNPLGALLTNLQFLQGELSDAEQDVTDAISESVSLCEAMERLLRNLSLLARGQAVSGHRHLVSMRAVVAEGVSRRERQATSAGVELIAEVGAAPDVLVAVDRELFSHATENLISYAIEQAPPGTCLGADFTVVDGHAVLTVETLRASHPDAPPPPDEPPPTLRRHELRYGRGLTLLCVEMAACGAGARLEEGDQVRLIAPVHQ